MFKQWATWFRVSFEGPAVQTRSHLGLAGSCSYKQVVITTVRGEGRHWMSGWLFSRRNTQVEEWLCSSTKPGMSWEEPFFVAWAVKSCRPVRLSMATVTESGALITNYDLDQWTCKGAGVFHFFWWDTFPNILVLIEEEFISTSPKSTRRSSLETDTWWCNLCDHGGGTSHQNQKQLFPLKLPFFFFFL